MAAPLLVTSAEAGQKLLQFLARRFGAPQGDLHRWIRTGQVRINGKRAKAFDRVAENDQIRVPPFAQAPPNIASDAPRDAAPAAALPAKLPPLVAETDALLVFNKPSGLPTHPGTGHEDSLASRLAFWYADAPFRPTPAHRLDKDTSGLLLAARSYTALRELTEAFAAHDGSIVKEYLAWVSGDCPWDSPRLLEARLRKEAETAGREKMRVFRADEHDAGKIARLTARCVERRNGASLLLIRLHTGRTHQIRAQLAASGFPLVGDVKYGGPVCRSGLKLHAARLNVQGVLYEALPPTDGPGAWQGAWAVKALPSLESPNVFSHC